MESIRTLNISKTKMFGARENDCHSWDESGMWLVMMSASVFRTNHNLSQDTTLSNLLILAICRTLLANKLSSSANLFVPKTSKMAMICLQVESSEDNPIISSSNASDICFRSLFVCEFLKRRISYVHSILQPTQLIQPNGKSKVEIRRKRDKVPLPLHLRGLFPRKGRTLMSIHSCSITI